jgi:hypothetical protein
MTNRTTRSQETYDKQDASAEDLVPTSAVDTAAPQPASPAIPPAPASTPAAARDQLPASEELPAHLFPAELVCEPLMRYDSFRTTQCIKQARQNRFLLHRQLRCSPSTRRNAGPSLFSTPLACLPCRRSKERSKPGLATLRPRWLASMIPLRRRPNTSRCPATPTPAHGRRTTFGYSHISSYLFAQ